MYFSGRGAANRRKYTVILPFRLPAAAFLRCAILCALPAAFTGCFFCAQPAAAQAPAPGAAAASAPKEDWTRLAVDRAVLRPILPGVSLGKEERPNYTRELIRMEWRHGDFIDVNVVKPRGVEKPAVVLYLYSFPSDTDRFMNDGWCSRATRDGMAAVGFVSALTGPRFRNRPMREWFLSELQESMGSSAHDVQLILDYLASRGDLSMDRVGMWAQGSGASIAVLAAAADPRIKALDLLDPWGDWPDWLKSSPSVPEDERSRYLAPEFLEKVSMVDPVIFLPQLRNRALRVQQIMDDQETPPSARDKIATAVPDGHLVQYKDRAAHKEAWSRTGISGWIAAQFHLSSPATASVAGNAN